LLVSAAIKKYALSVRKACEIFCISRSAYYHQNIKRDDSDFFKAQEIIEKYCGIWGYWKIYNFLRDKGFVINHKRVYRLCKKFKKWKQAKEEFCKVS